MVVTLDPIDVVYVVYGVPHLTLLSMQHLFFSGVPIRRLFVFDNVEDDAFSHERLTRLFPAPHVYVRQRDNPGVYRTLNRALAMTETRHVLLASSDFFCWPGWYSGVAAAMAQVPDLGWCGPAWDDADWFRVGPTRAWTALEDDYPQGCQLGRLNSAHGVLDWPLLRERVGTFDERFFFTYGDTDYLERMAEARVQTGCVTPVRGLHAVQQSRATIAAEKNVVIEMFDEAAFHAKWAHRPDILARHPFQGSYADRLALWQTPSGRPDWWETRG